MNETTPGPGGFADEDPRHPQDDLRERVAIALLGRADIVATDAAAGFPFGGGDGLDSEYCARVGHVLTQLLGAAIRDGRLDARHSRLADLRRVTLERGLPTESLFTYAYLTERTGLDELALDPMIGATTEAWPLVAQLVRRASFDLLGAYAEHTQHEPNGAAITDRLTTLYSRPVFDAALGKVADRAGRFGDSFSIILFDVDNLAAINHEFGYGVGDRVLERLSIQIKAFFRQHDWVARYSEDAVGVILWKTELEDATVLAERVRITIEERLGFNDHRSDQPVRVTISAGVVNLAAAAGTVIDPERVMADAERALEQAKRSGRNRVARADGYSRSS